MKTLGDITLREKDRGAVEAAAGILRRRFPVERVVLSTLVVSMEEWNEGLWQVLPVRQEIERDGVRA